MPKKQTQLSLCCSAQENADGARGPLLALKRQTPVASNPNQSPPLRKPLVLTSIDIGTKNMGLSVLEEIIDTARTYPFRILYYEQLDVHASDFRLIVKRIAEAFCQRPILREGVDVVLIESQGAATARMRGVSAAVHSFFETLKAVDPVFNAYKVEWSSGNVKLRTLEDPDNPGTPLLSTSQLKFMDYRVRKATGKLHCRTILEYGIERDDNGEMDNEEDAKMKRALLARGGKMDDLCDSVLQGVFYIKNHMFKPKKLRKKRIVATHKPRTPRSLGKPRAGVAAPLRRRRTKPTLAPVVEPKNSTLRVDSSCGLLQRGRLTAMPEVDFASKNWTSIDLT